MGRGLPYFPLYPEDFTSDALAEVMTTEEFGAYVLLICKAWGQNPAASVPDDDRVLARWARLPPARWKRLKARVMAPFRLKEEDSRWYEKRLRRIYDELLERSSKAREAAGKRWGSADASAMPEHSERNAEADAGALPEQPSGNAEPVAPFSLSISGSGSSSSFRPPSLEEVRTYWSEKGLLGSPEKFFERHTAGGWSYGRTKIKNWKAAARTWSLNEKEVGGNRPGSRPRNAVHRPGEYENVKSEVIEQGSE